MNRAFRLCMFVFAVVLILAVAAPQGGCENQEKARQEAAQVDADLQARQRALAQALADPTTTPQERAVIEATLAGVTADRAKLADALARLDAAAAVGDGDPIVGAIRGVAGALPPPWGSTLMLGVPGVVLLMKLFRTNSAAKGLAQTVEYLKKRVPGVETAMKDDADTINSLQNGKAKAIVDSVQGKAVPVGERIL